MTLVEKHAYKTNTEQALYGQYGTNIEQALTSNRVELRYVVLENEIQEAARVFSCTIFMASIELRNNFREKNSQGRA